MQPLIRRSALPFLLAWLLILPAVTGGQELRPPPKVPTVWTAEQAVDFALTHSPDSRIVLERLRAAEAQARMADAADLPSVTLSSEYSQTDNPMYSFGNILNQGAFDNSIDFNDPGRTDNLQLKAAIHYRLYSGGKDTADRRTAAARVEGAATDRTSLDRLLAFEVVRAFHTVIQAEEMTAVRETALEAITASLTVAQARFEAGTLLQQDLLTIELQQATASENLIAGRHAEELARRRFLNLLGLPQGEVRLDGATGIRQELPPTVSAAGRHELEGLKAAIRAAESAVAAARAEKRPSLDSFASYQIDHGTVLDDGGDSWMAGLRLNYNLYDGDHTNATVALAESRLREARARLAKAELDLDLEVQQAELDYNQAGQRLQVTEKMVAAAEETARLSRERFKEGVILAIDLIDVETRLSDALARRSSAKALHRVARANLRRAMGLPQFAESQDIEKEISQ
ncbi:MAG: TolC family protein [Desulfoprunum sp.]|uniref:TolC family protein n=1 Tax=Desulfoprunum sp. TaxID=2020866 RepID=UPI003C759ABE